MSSKSRLLIFLVSTPLVLFVAVGGVMGASTNTRQQSFPQLSIFQDVVSLVMNAYVEPVDPDKAMDGAMRGLADGLDPGSAYLLPDEVSAIQAKTALPAGDTGLTITRQFYLRIVGVRDGSPAAKAGLHTNDFIRMIDDKPTRDLSAFTGTHLLAGAPGSKVSVMIIRGSAVDPRVFDLVREAAPAERVTSRKLATGEGYIRVESFSTGAADALRKHADAMKQAGASGLLIDLRGTADGPLDEGIAAARLFVKAGTIATLAGRGTDKTITAAQPGDGAITMPVVLLTTNGTANAAELFASALQGTKRAALVGEPTAGIAALQHLVTLPENHGFWLTYARYLEASGTPIQDHGLKPDTYVDEPTVGFDEVAPTTDAILTKAEEVLRGKKD
jgi:carboxyl-terminal processing protease